MKNAYLSETPALDRCVLTESIFLWCVLFCLFVFMFIFRSIRQENMLMLTDISKVELNAKRTFHIIRNIQRSRSNNWCNPHWPVWSICTNSKMWIFHFVNQNLSFWQKLTVKVFNVLTCLTTVISGTPIRLSRLISRPEWPGKLCWTTTRSFWLDLHRYIMCSQARQGKSVKIDWISSIPSALAGSIW